MSTIVFIDTDAGLGPHAYWRAKNPTDGYFGTLEIEFRTTATGNTAVSATNTGGTPISGGYYNRGGEDLNPGNAFNGSFSAPRFSSDATVNAGVAWVGYHFASPVLLAEMALVGSGSGQDFSGAVTIDYSDDGSAWTTAKTLSVSGLSASAFTCYAVP